LECKHAWGETAATTHELVLDLSNQFWLLLWIEQVLLG
jgi:hypothetical protein